jgi:prepilin-type N-terminal cleavage/methylation domain-containing protein
MRRTETIRRQREGYTLIELLVVMAIIALLAGILLQAIMKIQAVGPRVKTKGEMHELELAIESFKSTYDVKYVPSALILSSDYTACATANPTWAPALLDSQRYLSKVWPKVGWGMSPNPAVPQTSPQNPITLDGNQVLVFLLGGVGPTDNRFTFGYNGNRSGFLNSPTNPLNMSGGVANSPPSGDKAKGPFYQFKADRINQDSHYVDPYGTPYYYFSSKNGNDYGYFGGYVLALNPQNLQGGFDANGGYGGMDPFIGADGKFIRSDTFQIISAGKDKQAGPGGLYQSGVGSYSPGGPGGDDLANFHNGVLGGEEG